MKTTDIFQINRSSRRLNESLEKTFGKKLNLENFDLHQLQDARNKLRTQISQVRAQSGFNETIENDALTQAQFMLDAINAEITEREEFVIEPAVEENIQDADFSVDALEQGDINTSEAYINSAKDAVNILADIRKQSKMAELGQGDPVRPNQLVNDLWDVMQWIEANMEESSETNEDIQGEDMTKLQEGEIQQASAIVSAKTMVDRVGRWIEELSGMENDTLLQLGDQIRDEMGQEQAKSFISAVAPAIQQALENLKQTRETLATGVRTLTGEEQGAEMLGAEPEAPAGDEGDLGAAEPDMMNTGDDLGGDEFAAAEPAAGGGEAAGREQRESINYESRLLKVLAG